MNSPCTALDGSAGRGRRSSATPDAAIPAHAALCPCPAPRPHNRGSLGTAHVHPLAALVRAGQAKHGSMAGMAAAGREKEAKKERAAASKREAAEARRAALAEAAGVEIT